MDVRLKRTALLIAMAGNVSRAAGDAAAGKAYNFDGILIITILIILGLVGTIGLLIYSLARFSGKVGRRFNKNSPSI